MTRPGRAFHLPCASVLAAEACEEWLQSQGIETDYSAYGASYVVVFSDNPAFIYEIAERAVAEGWAHDVQASRACAEFEGALAP